MAFPRLNAMSFWTLFTASMVLLASFFVPDGPAAAGWTSYAPLSDNPLYTGVNWGINLWILAVALEFASFLMGGVNFLTTAINMRAPGMTLWRLPLMVWMEITAAVVFLLSVGPLVAGAVMLLLDRTLGTGFFLPDRGGDPLLVGASVLVLRPSRSLRRRAAGLRNHAGSDAGVLAQADLRLPDDRLLDHRRGPAQFRRVGASHVRQRHGSAPRDRRSASRRSLISVPFAIMVFAMIATLWRGSISFTTPMLFALGGLASFHVRRRDRDFPRLRRSRYLLAWHLLRGRALPLHAFPDGLLRRVCRAVLLVSRRCSAG